MPNSKVPFSLLILCSILFSACNFPGAGNATATMDPVVALTGAALTVESKLATAEANSTPPTLTPTEAFFTPIPTFTSAPQQQQPTSTRAVVTPYTLCDAAYFQNDITIPDGTEVSPGAKFTKTWELRNDGTCTWTDQYGLAFDASDSSSAKMSGPDFQNFPSGTSVSPGASIKVSVELTAPTTPGTYRGYWLLRNASGNNFGLGGASPFWVEIVVKGPTATPTATPTGTSAPIVSITLSYVGTTTCSTQDVAVFKVTNTGNVALESTNSILENPPGTQVVTVSDASPFQPVGGGVADVCSGSGAAKLATAGSAWIQLPLASLPTGGNPGRVTVKACTQDGLAGVCTSQKIDFTW